MKIVIAGAGEVGSHLAKLLSNEQQDITVVDTNTDRLDRLDQNYNLMTVAGRPTSFRDLRTARAGQCDLFIAVTPYESENIVACSMAKSLGATRTVARIDTYDFMDPVNLSPVKRMGVDQVIYPEYLAALEIETALHHSWIRQWFELHGGQIILVGVRLRAGAPLEGMQLKEFASTNHHFHVSAIRRNHASIIPRGDDRMEANDILYITTTPDHVQDLIELTGKTSHRIRRVLVLGGSKIAVRLAALASRNFKIKIIEHDPARCAKLPELCPDCEIICGDGRDSDVLDEAGIHECDAFVALTDSSETNILACLTAKSMGIKKTVAEVESLQFISQAEALNIGSIVNKKLLAASSIFQMLLDTDSSTSKCLALTDAEVAEFEARAGSKITTGAIRDLQLPRNVTLAGMIRDGHGELITGNTRLQAGDRVLVFCMSGMLHKVERLFT